MNFAIFNPRMVGQLDGGFGRFLPSAKNKDCGQDLEQHGENDSLFLMLASFVPPDAFGFQDYAEMTASA